MPNVFSLRPDAYAERSSVFVPLCDDRRFHGITDLGVAAKYRALATQSAHMPAKVKEQGSDATSPVPSPW